MQTSAIAPSSSRDSTRPVGLCGELISITRAAGPTAARNASTSTANPGGRSVTGRRRAPANAMHAAYES